jgi:RND family efflux transporter MFP subunit
MRRRSLYLGLGLATVAVIGVLALGGCGGPARATGNPEVRSSGRPELLPKVVVQEARAFTRTREEELPGTLAAWEVTPLYSRATGYVESVSVDIGDEVEAGAEIARIVVPELAAELRRARARVVQERAELALARLTSERLHRLYQSTPEALPAQDVDVAIAQVEVEAAQLELAGADQERLEALNRFARVVAPFKGRIVERGLDTGALAREGTSSGAVPVVTIARTSRLRLVLDVPEPLARDVGPGTRVRVLLDAFPGEEVTANVARVSGSLDPATRSMRAEVDLDNEGERYSPGMYATVTVTTPALAGAIVVPSRAVRGEGHDRHCLVVHDSVVSRRRLVVLSDDGRDAVIADGLAAGEEVVVASSPLVSEGARVEAVSEGAAQ